MVIHGVEVTADNVEWLRVNLDDPAAQTLRGASDDDSVMLRFADEEADQVLTALNHPPPGLEELRAALLHERERRPI